MNRGERWLFAGVAGVFVLLISLPFLAGWAAQTTAVRFGGAVYDRQDIVVYLAAMQQGARDPWRYTLRFTGEEQRLPFYVRHFYLWLGYFAHRAGWPDMLVFHGARVLFTIGALWGWVALARFWLSDAGWALLASLAPWGLSGLGWLQRVTGWGIRPGGSPMDWWLFDAYPLFMALVLPHFVAALGLLALVVYGFSQVLNGARLCWLAASGVALLLLWDFAPHVALLADGLMGSFWLAAWWLAHRSPRRGLSSLLVLAALQVPPAFYLWWLQRAHPVWRAFMQQNVTRMPPWSYVLWGFGLLWPPALLGAWHAVRHPTPWRLTMLVWVLGAFGVASLPFALQRRFLFAVTLPLGALALEGWQVLKPRLSLRLFRLGLVGWLGFASLTSLMLVFGGMQYVWTRPERLFDPADVVHAMRFLQAEAQPDALVCAVERTGWLVASQAGLRAFVGHPMETLAYEQKQQAVQAFFLGEATTDWPFRMGCDWVVYGPFEQAVAPHWRPGPGLTLRWLEGRTQLYEVADAPP